MIVLITISAKSFNFESNTMKSTLYIILAMLIVVSCKKNDVKTPTSGTVTIDNTTYTGTTYYYYGFSFDQGKKITTMVTPWPDIVLYVNNDNTPARLTFQTRNNKPSFFKLGDFADEASAKTAFDNLKTVGDYQWTAMADPVKPNQVWVYRSETENYAKIRIISTVNEPRNNVDFGECTFQWVYQPDGSLNFPE